MTTAIQIHRTDFNDSVRIHFNRVMRKAIKDGAKNVFVMNPDNSVAAFTVKQQFEAHAIIESQASGEQFGVLFMDGLVA
jgi:hypothetical protein